MTILGNYGYIGNLREQAKIVSMAINPFNVDYAVALLLETAAAETALGTIVDKTVYAGMGLCQFDRKPFYYVRDKSMKYRKNIIEKIKIDLTLVEWEDLRYNPFLSLLFCRLYYFHIPKPIPTTIKGRAKYWKKYYNTYLGKGTIKHYIKMSNRFLYKTSDFIS